MWLLLQPAQLERHITEEEEESLVFTGHKYVKQHHCVFVHFVILNKRNILNSSTSYLGLQIQNMIIYVMHKDI